MINLKEFLISSQLKLIFFGATIISTPFSLEIKKSLYKERTLLLNRFLAQAEPSRRPTIKPTPPKELEGETRKIIPGVFITIDLL